MPIVIGTNTYTFSSIDTLTGSGNADAVTLSAGQTNASVDLAAGNDTLTLANATNSLTVANTETLTGAGGVARSRWDRRCPTATRSIWRVAMTA